MCCGAWRCWWQKNLQTEENLVVFNTLALNIKKGSSCARGSLHGKKNFINTFLLRDSIFAPQLSMEFSFSFMETTFIACFPIADNLCSWDAGWYRSIIEKGYQYDPKTR